MKSQKQKTNKKRHMVRIWNNGNCWLEHKLVQSLWIISCKAKVHDTYGPVSQKNSWTLTPWGMYKNVHNSVVYNNKKWETNQMITERTRAKEIFSNKKQWTIHICIKWKNLINLMLNGKRKLLKNTNRVSPFI